MDTKPMLIRPRQLSMLETAETPSRPVAPAKPVRIRATAISGERREHCPKRSRMESRPDQLPNKQQLADAEEIAQRVKDTSRSATIEHLLNRQMNRQPKLFEGDRQPQPRLEHLAIARRSDDYYHLVSPRSGKPISRYGFETARYCAEAAAELENTFDLEGMLDFVEPELLTHIEAIVLASVWRETVAIEIAVA